ncbi:group II intron reverse transcriptase/maturase [Aquimarina muelleri]|uniref:RNA-directed DNA polymerase n=1 Tax=Aquimarina muelleri TaxID=279356 RepID=A0A918JZL7_9FLAO|nr:group II intron reverse transcriptase/maturase [Aquimarina muelleri]MCX2765097.1 group II intron reverse transcriptase/maturase [Aquimarina muelleri]GGX35840.1 group II intron reverse transcriptase/maturase [Aquimarina muelleri]
MTLWNETKSIPISRQIIWQAYQQVRSNKGSAGVDAIDMEEFDANRNNHLYKLWNRMASGSYFPPPVKEVEISKKDGSIRKLGIPTISDRVGQMAVKMFIEPRLEAVFSPNSYGYRPKRNAHQALSKVRENCWKQDWVIDLDIKGFFDTIDHNKLMLAVKKHVPEKWILLYIKRWLEAPVFTTSGELLQKQGMGTPQGGVISPLLANLFLHYAFDKWLENTGENVLFTRYADDVIVHCRSKAQAEQVLQKIHQRMTSVRLELHPEKTKIVYCRDHRRRGDYPKVKFDFLGYSFQPRTAFSKKKKALFLGYDCAISISSRKRIADKLEELNVGKLTFKSIVGVAQYLNPMIRGWVGYYGKFKMYELTKVFRLLSQRLVWWARKRYKRYKTSIRKGYKWLATVRKQYPNLFYHWQFSHINVIA